MKKLTMNFIKLFGCLLFILCNSCSIFNKNNIHLNFSSKEWKKDILGSNGYRAKVLKQTKLFENLKGHTNTDIKRILGKTDFYCSNKNGFTYQYNYEYGRFNGQNKYDYKPEADCMLNKNFGSVVCLEFDNNSKLKAIVFITKG